AVDGLWYFSSLLGDTDGNAAGSMERLVNSGRWNGIATEHRLIFTHIAKFPLFQRIGAQLSNASQLIIDVLGKPQDQRR
uniref:hypothetical protein n=1 Tax=Xanthomonas graminis TaxID=3390026 RepID=UPI001BB07111